VTRDIPRSRPDAGPPWNERVRASWNRVSYRYRPRAGSTDCFGHRESDYRAWLRPLLRGVSPGSEVLDLGCGTGIPATRMLAARFRVTGVDLSDVQIRRARRLVPRARFVRANMSEVGFPPATFAAVVCLYSLIHVPRREHRPLLRRIASWLAPGGWFLAILGHSKYEGSETGWLGSDAPMYWSHYDAGTYRRWIRSEGLRVVREEFIPEGGGGHHLFLARKGCPISSRRASARRTVERWGRPEPGPPRPTRARRPREGRGRPPSRSP